VHGLDVTFGAGALFGLIALVMAAALIRLPAPARSSAASATREDAEVEVVDGEGFEWSDPELVA
jgi:hypothetical protein